MLLDNTFRNSYFFTEKEIYIRIYMLLHTKFGGVCLVERQFLPAMENRVKFLILWHRILRLILSMKEGQNFDHMKA